MSRNHPIIALTGASGAGRESVRDVFNRVLVREGLTAAYVAGESFHRHNRAEFKQASAAALAEGNRHFSHFGPDANLFDEQEKLYQSYGANGTGTRRFYLHSAEDGARWGYPEAKAGEFTPWEDLPPATDLLLYEGLHGAVRGDGFDLGRHVDLKIGVVPIINLEWIQKVHRDTGKRGYSTEAVTANILDRMYDYVHYILPQFKHSDINFQHVPVVDTSDPFIARDIPTLDERVVVIRFRKPEDLGVDFPWLMDKIQNAWMSRRNSIVVPGGKVDLAIELIFTPILRRMMENRARKAA
ncbi:phosphoribulokinase [Magnetospirillum sp. UT-4]|uniref:phosphoribulokinase n=1 Tax=Magnetospirillum sp. UT-4 TaxID=2681467 RepID=UPI001380C295|nr:phosphoribulokinase [Magnetospirillum sp. UT-4]CAA7618354.1 Phosphoribulokinase [Magnetospirillum sp. UT-4]